MQILTSVYGLLVTFLMQLAPPGQGPAWHFGVARIDVRQDLGRRPGSAFVVALSG